MNNQPPPPQRTTARNIRKLPYAPTACSECRRRRVRCDWKVPGPACGTCLQYARADRCMWVATSDVPKVSSRLRQHELQKRCMDLEAVVDWYVQRYGDAGKLEVEASHRPAPDYVFEEHEDADLIESTRKLTVEGGRFIFYGNSAPWHFSTPSPPTTTSRFVMDGAEGHYTLEEGYKNPSFDWSRHLPATSLTRAEHDKILARFFNFFTGWSLRIVPTLFLRDMYLYIVDANSKPTHYSPMLHNAIVALAIAFSDDEEVRKENGVKYAELAKTLMDRECEHPSIATIQALSLLGSVYCSRGNRGFGYACFGMSVSVGQMLGLGLDCSHLVENGTMTQDDVSDREVAYWSGLVMDMCWSLYVGRDCSTPSPKNIPAVPLPSVVPELDRILWRHPESGLPQRQGYLSTTFQATCRLHVIGRLVLDFITFEGNGAGGIHDEAITAMDDQLNQWKESLPEAITLTSNTLPHVLMVHMLFHLFRILLHRPFFYRRQLSGDSNIEHRKICKDAANEIMSILDTWRSLYTLRFVPITIVEVIFTAGTVFLLLHRRRRRSSTANVTSTVPLAGMQVDEDPFAVYTSPATLYPNQMNVGRPPSAMSFISTETTKHADTVKRCIAHLHEISQSIPSALGISEILTRLLEGQVTAQDEDPAVASPASQSLWQDWPPLDFPGYVSDFHSDYLGNDAEWWSTGWDDVMRASESGADGF